MYTFDVYWEESDISWASRWDAYLNMPGGRVHWFSILNSLMVVLVMSSIVAMIMMRTIRRDLQRYEGLLGDAGLYSISVASCPWHLFSIAMLCLYLYLHHQPPLLSYCQTLVVNTCSNDLSYCQ